MMASEADYDGPPLCEIRKSRVTVIARVNRFKGHTMLDMREYVTDSMGALRPTPKGLTVPIDRVRELATALAQVSA